jgi:hypothetical protein
LFHTERFAFTKGYDFMKSHKSECNMRRLAACVGRLIIGAILMASLCVSTSRAVAGDGPIPKDAKNLCPNGDFQHLQEAAARPLPQDWSAYGQGVNGRVEMSNDQFNDKRSLRLAAVGDNVVGINGTTIAITHGYVRFHYKLLSSAADGANFLFSVIGLNGPQGSEVKREGFIPPKEHVGDGHWHEGHVEFNYSAQRARHCLVAPRVNESVKRGQGDWLIAAVEVYSLDTGPKLRVANVWSDKPLARQGGTIRYSAWIENVGDKDAENFSVQLQTSEGISMAEAIQRIPLLAVDSYCRVDWQAKAEKPARVALKVIAKLNREEFPAEYKTLVIDRDAQYTRQELCTDEIGYWQLLTQPKTLQDGNTSALTAITHKQSSEIKRSTYGMCTHLPRAKDYEDPFNPSHLIDDDPETVWSSQQKPSPFPGNFPWVDIDLGRSVAVNQVNLIPYWMNTDFPLGFTIRTSLDGQAWQEAISVKSYHFHEGPRRGDKIVQQFKLKSPISARHVRIDFERLPLSSGNYAEICQGYKARLSGIEVIDPQGKNIALKSQGVTIEASDTFTGWQNTAKTVNDSFDRLFDIGLKWVRVGQWGDQTEWAAVEREKGKFHMDSVTDAAIQKLCDNGVRILYGLNYGNMLYNDKKEPFIDVGPIFNEGSPFCHHGGPRTKEARQAFCRYVDVVARKYKGRITYWELWNEENAWFPGNEPELYGKLLAAVGKTLKSIDPNNKLMFGGTAAAAPITTEIALREGGAPYVDICAMHPYGLEKPEGGMGTCEFIKGKNLCQSPEQTGWKCIEDVLAGVRKPYAKYGKADIPVWLNEWTPNNPTGLDFSFKAGFGEFACSKYLLRFYAYSGWLNAPTAWWAFYNENMSQDWGVIEQHGYGFRPMSYALQNICSFVSDVEPIRTLQCKYEGPASDMKTIAYQRDASDEKLVLVWAAEMHSETIKAYPGRLSIKLEKQPTRVMLTDLYWGVSQPAIWSYENGVLTLNKVVVRDYPIAISYQ